ncbi:MAG: cysteine desulfurase-like protein [Acidimicrobiales bacterium]
MTSDLRHRFPGLNDGWARFDGPAGTQMVDTAIDAMADWMRSGSSANSHGPFDAAARTDALMSQARQTLGELLGGDPSGVVFGPNMTTMMLGFTRSVAQTLKPGDEVLCTSLDHDANVTPWASACADAGATLVMAPFDPTSGRIEVASIADRIGKRTRWVAVTGASNAIGTMPDVRAITKAAHEVGSRVAIDAVHLAPHAPIDVAAIGCDALFCSPYKWYGPHAGVMWADPELLSDLEPYKLRPADDRVPARWETGTPSFEAIAGVEAAARFLLAEGLESIAAAEASVFGPVLGGLLDFEHVTVYGPRGHANRTPTVAFTVHGQTPAQTAASLAEEKIAVWSGDYYAVDVMRTLGLPDGAVRAGVVRYITDDDTARLLDRVRKLRR